MKKLWMLVLGALLATGVAMAQDAGQDDMKSAGHNTKEAAKDVANGTKKAAVKVGHATKKAAIATKNAVTGDKDETKAEERKETAAEERAEHEHNSTLPQSDRTANQNAAGPLEILTGPDVDARNNSATIRWTTNKVAATDVWLTGGGIRGHRTSYVHGGSREHHVTFSNLRPNTTYNFAIRTRKGDVRKEGSFTTR